MTGRPLGDILPFTNRPLFGERTRDITNDPDHVNVIGFSYDDVVHLGNALLGKSYDLAAAMKLEHSATEMTRTVYCARQVTSVLSELLNGSKLDDILADESLSSTLQDTPHNFPSDSRLHMDAVNGPPNLPPEITLLVAEHAALRELHTERAWVASLCLVCWSFKRVLTPILYSSVTTRSDADARQIVALAQRPDNPLQYTRSVQLFQLGTTYTAGATDQIMRLGQALTNVSRFAGHDGAIDGLAHGNPTLRLSTIFITSTTDEWSECDDGALCPSRRIIQSAQRLHLVIDFSMEGVPMFPDWLHSCEAAYLIVDAFSKYESTESDELFTWFYEALEPFLRSRSLQRILLRPRYPGNTEAFSSGVVAWAERVRDSRICLDDSFVSPPGLEWMQFMDIDMDDVLVGDALWEHGQQVWRPS
ncbi:hypothetical protein EXIGLDRAFT_774492 [Exidia glandulosa HHB12029]|uniref:F-box domain-containing protein n=1 Tax=Exidia glandulosa HHB12029 TaxID=1314781 RepID=A0A165ECJ0_EXIGL|nr:hypothetical protein EXIGLDRAFT_774492 [Exidia glandulosa HHB12029]